MNLKEHLAKHLNDVFFGGNWTTSCYRDHLKDVTWEEATTQIENFNTIAALFFHSTYYVSVLLKVLHNGVLEGKDEESFKIPDISSQEEWVNRKHYLWTEVAATSLFIGLMPESKLWEPFTDEKHGTYYRNIAGTIEHLHYHLGQIVMLKKMIRAQKENPTHE